MVSDDIKWQVSITLQSSITLLEDTLLTVIIYNHNVFILFKPQELYSQHFIFFVTYEWVQKVRAFVPGKTFQPSPI